MIAAVYRRLREVLIRRVELENIVSPVQQGATLGDVVVSGRVF